MNPVGLFKHNGWRFTVVENKYSHLLKVHITYSLAKEYDKNDMLIAIDDAKEFIDKLNIGRKHAKDEER